MAVLGTVGIADKGNYDPSATYVFGNSVYYEGSTWVAKKDNLTGIPPEEGENWKYLARGFGSDNLSQIEGKDTSGVLGTAGADVISQDLIDALADRVMTKLFPIANLVNNGLTTQEGFALDARYGKALKDLLDTTNSNLADVSDSLSSVKAKAPSDLAYISAFDIRINDQVGPYTASLISDVTFMITGKELKSGAFGYSNVIYTDKPAGVNDWGYVEYFKHADNYVTVKIYPEDSLAFYIRRFDIGLADWTSPWQKVQYTV